MVTAWVPVPADIERNFAVLDRQRLGAQRGHEGVILARGTMARVEGRTYGWQQHPACVMWTGHERALMDYLVYAVREWRRRGYHDECLPEYLQYREQLEDTGWPDWWGRHPIHERHRQWLLLREWPHYSVLPEFAGEVDFAWDWMHQDGFDRLEWDSEPPLVWPVTGVISYGEGAL